MDPAAKGRSVARFLSIVTRLFSADGKRSARAASMASVSENPT
jgi:hypothetical protein